LIVTNRFYVENPVTGKFQPQEKSVNFVDSQKKQDQAKVDEDENQLENIPLLAINFNGDLDKKSKLVSLPKFPHRRRRPQKSVQVDDDEDHDEEEWISIRMDYRNFAFAKRSIFFIFQGLLGGFCVITIFFQRILVCHRAFHLIIVYLFIFVVIVIVIVITIVGFK
jgi:hypothetical protein